MGWVKKVSVHVCDPPRQTRAGVGSVWKCRRCKRKWELIRKVAHPPYGIVISSWTRYFDKDSR